MGARENSNTGRGFCQPRNGRSLCNSVQGNPQEAGGGSAAGSPKATALALNKHQMNLAHNAR